MQAPPEHVSGGEHFGGCWQAPATQLSFVQGSVSAQLIGECWQAPATQMSAVQGSVSSQLIWECWQAPATQLSFVQESVSAQLIGVCWHDPEMHASVVQGSPSSLQTQGGWQVPRNGPPTHVRPAQQLGENTLHWVPCCAQQVPAMILVHWYPVQHGAGTVSPQDAAAPPHWQRQSGGPLHTAFPGQAGSPIPHCDPHGLKSPPQCVAELQGGLVKGSQIPKLPADAQLPP